MQAQQSSGSGGAALMCPCLLNLVLNASHAAGHLARIVPQKRLEGNLGNSVKANLDSWEDYGINPPGSHSRAQDCKEGN